MSDYEVGTPPPTPRKSQNGRWPALAAVALENRGQWVSAPLDDGSNTGASNSILRSLAQLLGCEVSAREGTIYVRVPE